MSRWRLGGRFLIPLLAFALLVVVLANGIRHADRKGTIDSPLVGRPAPEFALPSLTDPNRLVGSQDLQGRWYVLNVWGTWCPGCYQEHETLMEVARSGVVPIVGLNWKDDDAQALAWLAQLGNPYEWIAVDRDGRVAIDWGVYGAPETFLVDDRGIVVHKHTGPLTSQVWKRDFLPLLPQRVTSRSE